MQREIELIEEWDRVLQEIAEKPEIHNDAECALWTIIRFYNEKNSDKLFLGLAIRKSILFFHVNLDWRRIDFYTTSGLIISFSLHFPSFKAEPPRLQYRVFSLHAPEG